MSAERMTREEALRLFRTLNMMMRDVAMERAQVTHVTVVCHDDPRVRPDITGPGTKPLNDFLRKRRRKIA